MSATKYLSNGNVDLKALIDEFHEFADPNFVMIKIGVARHVLKALEGAVAVMNGNMATFEEEAYLWKKEWGFQ